MTNAELRQKFVDEIKKQGKPYGLYFADIQGGFTLTQRALPQAFQVLPVMVWKVFTDGKPDELVRGVNIVGTPIAALNRIRPTGDTMEVFNGVCGGAASGSVPVSAAAPAMLFSEIEVQNSRTRWNARRSCRHPVLKRRPRNREARNENKIIGTRCDPLKHTLSGTSKTTAADPVLTAMHTELERSKAQLKLENMGAPYYIDYRVMDLDAFEAEAAYGAITSNVRTQVRYSGVVVRVGSYKQDSLYGQGMGTIEVLPLDNDIQNLRHQIWLATDQAYKAATEALTEKQARLKNFTVDQPVDDFAQAEPVDSIGPLVKLDVDPKSMVETVRKCLRCRQERCAG